MLFKPTRQITLLFVLLCVCFLQARSQVLYNYLKDDSVQKKQYADDALAYQKSKLAGLPSSNSKDYKMVYEDRFKGIESFLKSSRAVTDPAANQYLQSVVNKITEANPELKSLQLRVVFSRDWWPNAYSMGDGTVAVNAGLMIYLNSEAELAFVLSHELAHFYLDHSGKGITKYVETVNSEDIKKEIKRLSKQEFQVNKQFTELLKLIKFDNLRHSRANEAEADRYGWKFMKNTGYDCRGIISTLQILDQVDDTVFYPRLKLAETLNPPAYPFQKKWIEKESVLFGELKEDDSPLTRKERDSLKSHPDCSQRIAMLQDSVNNHPGGKLFLADENKFNELKKSFIPEFTEELYREDNLGRHLYFVLLQLQHDPQDKLAAYQVARCLNLLVDNQLIHKMGTLYEGESRYYPADYNMVLRMLTRIRLDDLKKLAIAFCDQYAPLLGGNVEFEKEWKKANRWK